MPLIDPTTWKANEQAIEKVLASLPGLPSNKAGTHSKQPTPPAVAPKRVRVVRPDVSASNELLGVYPIERLPDPACGRTAGPGQSSRQHYPIPLKPGEVAATAGQVFAISGRDTPARSDRPGEASGATAESAQAEKGIV